MCDPLIGGAIAGGALGLFNGIQQRKANRRASREARAQAEKDAKRAEQQYNKANQKQPDVASIFSNIKKDASKGLGGTFLTGSGGVNSGALPLGGQSLLGG